MSRRNVEAYLKAQGIPYVNIDDARRAIMPAGPGVDGPAPFHFAAYGPDANWLILVGSRTPENRATMAQWAELFGPPFLPVFARFRTHPVFTDIDGEPVELGPVPRATTSSALPTEAQLIAAREWLSDNCPEYAALEDRMAEAAAVGDHQTESDLCDECDALVLSHLRGEWFPIEAIPAEPERPRPSPAPRAEQLALF